MRHRQLHNSRKDWVFMCKAAGSGHHWGWLQLWVAQRGRQQVIKLRHGVPKYQVDTKYI